MPASRMESVEYRPHGGRGLLAGMLRCPLCGSPMRVKSGSAADAYYYVCTKKERGGRKCCAAENISGKAADAYALHITAAAMASAISRRPAPMINRMFDTLKKYFTDKSGMKRRLQESLTEDASGKLAENKAAIERLMAILEQAGDSAAAVHIICRINQLEEENRDLQERQNAEKKCGKQNAYDIAAEEMLNRLKNFENTLPENDPSGSEGKSLEKITELFDYMLGCISIECKRAVFRLIAGQVRIG